MDQTPKSKLFGFKNKNGRSFEPSSPSDDRPISKIEVIDLETLPISETAIPTSPVVSQMNTANQLSIGRYSPQFVVGWNDGAGTDDLYMCSPIRAVPVLRNIRRCPDSNNFKAPKRKPRDNKEDILQCIDWSKNLFETTSRKKDLSDEKQSPADEQKKDVKILTDNKQEIESQSGATDINIDILDDSADEMMILCSQAVERNLPTSRHPPVSPATSRTSGKHPITPDDHSRKRVKMDPASNAHKGDPKADGTSVNLNSHIENCDQSNFKVPSYKLETKTTSKVDLKAPNSSVPNQDLFEALLNDDEDDLFGSFDFHSIDKKLQTNQSKGLSLKSVSSNASIGVPKSNGTRNSSTKPVPKYTKEQIEQRRLEAKKRLLFNKKYKSV